MDLFDNKNIEKIIPHKKKITVELYTDGACSGNPGKGGYGYILICGKHIKKGADGFQNTTNNRMELLAVIEGLKQLKFSCNVNIYTDSQYIVNAFNKNWIDGWRKQNWRRKKDELKNVDLWKKLYELTLKHTVFFNWVKGHSDNVYNNECDSLAVNAYNQPKLLIDKNFETGNCNE